MSPVKVTTTWENPNPDTVWNKLAVRLGREPTNEEARADVERILNGRPTASEERAWMAREYRHAGESFE